VAAGHALIATDGKTAYLKVTPATLGPQAAAAARRELRFYQDLAGVAPVRTPRLLDCVDSENGVAALLEAAGEPLEASSWTPRMWADLGRELAALHNMPLPARADWNRPDELQGALAEPNQGQVETFWAGTLPQLADMLSRRSELEDQIKAVPPVFIHGDCHTDNSALVDAYLESRPCERLTLERALIAEELATFVFLWPPYAAFNSTSGIARVRQRTFELAERWFDTSAVT
jgi:Ser/Thr protein kinase RdoA (MazF antagonist)